MKALIIGYGSAGKRHYRVLKNLKLFSEVHIVTRQKNLSNLKVYKTITETKLDNYDYIIIASETARHYEDLTYITENIKNKIILCEKPLFCTTEKLLLQRNLIFVGYQLRFHPLIYKLKELINQKRVLFCINFCGYYLPFWRPDRDIRETYSSSRARCGGVVLDLSHEIDYLTYLFGSLVDVKGYTGKISALPIDSDDYLSIVGVTHKNTYISLTLDYISKIKLRKLFVHTDESSIEMDLIKGFLYYRDLHQEFKESSGEIDSDRMTELMHLDILNQRKYACTYDEAMKVMEAIDLIRERVL